MSLGKLRILCLAAVGSAALLLIALERRFPYRPGQAFLRRDFFHDFIVYSLVQSYGVGLLVSCAVGRLERARSLADISRWPIALQVALFLLEHDLALYWFHRLQHSSPYLWWTHALHHTNRELDWLAGSRATAFEIFMTELMKYAPMVLLGAAPATIVVRGTIDAIWGMYLHANLNVRSGALQRVLNGPEMHRWHHALDRDAWGKNLATKFALWDFWFGTAFWPAAREPLGFGLAGREMPRGYLRQQFVDWPLRMRGERATGVRSEGPEDLR